MFQHIFQNCYLNRGVCASAFVMMDGMSASRFVLFNVYVRSMVFQDLRFHTNGNGSILQWRHNGRDSASPASWLFTQPFIQTQIKEKNQCSVSLAFVQGIHRWPVNSQHKWPVTQKMFSFDDVIVIYALVNYINIGWTYARILAIWPLGSDVS